MKRNMSRAAVLAVLCVFVAGVQAATFNYHGNLQDAGRPAEGNYDLELTLYSAAEGGRIIAGPLLMHGVPVHGGSFATKADFGPLANASAPTWLGVRVRNAGMGEFAALSARAPIAADATATTCPGSWSVDGNAGTTSDNYVGTADAGSLLYLRAEGAQVARALLGSGGTPSWIGGGAANYVISENGSFIGGGGSSNFPDFANGVGPYGVVGGGQANSAIGNYSVVPGGYNNNADGDKSFAGGDGAAANQNHTFVWNDGGNFASTGDNQFDIHAIGGVGINTANGPIGTEPLNAEVTIRAEGGNGHETWLDLLAQTDASDPYRGVNLAAVPGGRLRLRSVYTVSGSVFYDPIMYVVPSHGGGSNAYIAFNREVGPSPSNAIFQVGTTTNNGGEAYLTAGGVWTNTSTRAFKEDFADVDALDVLSRVVAMPVRTWFYKNDHDEGRHMGPVAEDFAQAFGLGNDDRHIGTVDESGVAFAAIQGLNRKLEAANAGLRAEKDAQIDALRARLDATTASLAELREQLNRLEVRGE